MFSISIDVRNLLRVSVFLLAAAAAAQEDISTIAMPIRTTLAPLIPLVEAQVPKSIARTISETGFTVVYDIDRDPIQLSMQGEMLRARTVVHYGAQACPNFRRIPCLSCGMDEPKRDAIIVIHSKFSWDRDWRLRSASTAEEAEFPNRCRVTMLKLDITEHYIAPIVNDQLRSVARTVDRHTPELANLQPVARDVWNTLQLPYEIAPRTFLLFDPIDVALGGVRGNALEVTSTLTMRARTRIVVGDKPAVALKPLPPLMFGESAGGLRIPFDLEVPYAEASRLATEQFGHREYTLKSGRLKLEEIAISPGKSGRVAVSATIDYDGKYSGPIVLEGTPQYDQATRSVSIPDLDYSLESRQRSLFFRIGEWFAHDNVRDQLRASARFPLSEQIDVVTEEINRAINRPVADGVTLRGAVGSILPQRVTPAEGALIVRVMVTGNAEIAVTRLR